MSNVYDVAALIGLTLSEITTTYDTIEMTASDGRIAKFYHNQDCCETVSIEDVNGDWNDLVGTPILVAEKRTSNEFGGAESDNYDHHTWTFYTFRTIKGSVDVRWHGTSNGYYSESVDFIMLNAV